MRRKENDSQAFGPFGIGDYAFFLSTLAVGPLTQGWVRRYIKPGIIETVCENPISALFQGTLLQSLALQDPAIVPMYGSSEFGHGSPDNPTKLFAGAPTGWLQRSIFEAREKPGICWTGW